MHRKKRAGRRTLRTGLAALAASLLLVGGGLSSAQAGPAAGTGARAERTDAVFQQVTLARGPDEVGEPMSLALLPDGSVLHTSRDGTLRLTDSGGTTRVAGEIPVYTHDEEGLQGVGVDPNFAENRFIYLYYAPPLDTPEGDAPEEGTEEDFAPFEGVNRLSRFVLTEDGTLDLDSEQTVLEVPTDRGMCCHVGGDIAFDADGNLLLSTGDDTNPFASDGYSPLDDSEGRNPSFDARRSAGNTNDLRGKILRIKVNEDGSYDIPEGNLFPPGTENARPEIYAMGFRNPFRMSVDKPTGTIYVGDYGPDAAAASDERGPVGQVEFDRVTGPGNYGWPYCIGDNEPYVDYDFATGTSGEPFDCSAPVNDSRHNTGLAELPAAEPAWIPYDGDSVPEFGDGSESPMGGPVYRYDPDLDSGIKFPEEFDGDFFAGEFGRQWIKRIELSEDGTVESINDFPWEGTQVMDMEFGPDGALYVLDYGTGYFNGDENSALYRIENATDGFSPVPQAAADVTSGQAPLTVSFSSEGTSDEDSALEELSYAWDFGDGATSDDPNPTHEYTENGSYTVTLTVTDPTGKTGTASVHVTVGNTAPTVKLQLPADGQLFEFGDEVPFRVEVTDPEDEEIDCSRVKVSYVLGHDSHGHPLTSATGCEGTVQTRADSSHDPNANIFGVIDATYTDSGGNGQPELSGADQVVLQPRHRQAEHHGEGEGVQVANRFGAEGARTVRPTADDAWIAFTPYTLGDATEFTARVSAEAEGATIEVRVDGPDGDLLGTVEVPDTGDLNDFEEVGTALEAAPEDMSTLCLVLTGGDSAAFEVDAFTLTSG